MLIAFVAACSLQAMPYRATGAYYIAPCLTDEDIEGVREAVEWWEGSGYYFEVLDSCEEGRFQADTYSLYWAGTAEGDAEQWDERAAYLVWEGRCTFHHGIGHAIGFGHVSNRSVMHEDDCSLTRRGIPSPEQLEGL